MTDLLPCPFCGGEDLGVSNGDASDDWCAIYCRECFASGPHNYTDDHASKGWNTRAPGWQPIEKEGR